MAERVHLPLCGQLRDRVSYSELKLFSECEWRWLLTKVFDKAPEVRSFQMDFGSAVHSGMEALYGPGGSVEKATECAMERYDASLKTADLSHPSDRAEAYRIRECIPQFYRDCAVCPDLQGITTLKSELRLNEDIIRTDGLQLKFKGFIDIVFVKKLKFKTVIYVADFKTCQWGWPAQKFQDVEVISQLLLYKHFFCKMTGADPKNVSLAFILLKKKPRNGEITVEVAKIGAGPKATERAIEFMQQAITGMHSYSYEKNYEACIRSWIDKETKEERTAKCPFVGTENCPGSAEGSTGS
jgi:hypothetical protein